MHFMKFRINLMKCVGAFDEESRLMSYCIWYAPLMMSSQSNQCVDLKWMKENDDNRLPIMVIKIRNHFYTVPMVD